MTFLLDPYRLQFSKYFDWNDGRLDSFFTTTPGTVTNGIGILGHQNLGNRFNYFQALSRFYSAAVLSDLPRLDPSATQIIHRAAEHWSVCGECFLVRSGESLRLVRPDYVFFPVLNQYDANYG